MSKKSFENKLRTTIDNQDKAVQERFDKADSLLIKPLPPVPLPVTVQNVSGVVRDTFSMPPADYDLIAELRTKAARAGHIATKSDIVRAGLLALSALDEQQLVKAISILVRVLPGRKGKPL